MNANLNLKDIAAINEVMADLFGCKVNERNFDAWWKANVDNFLKGKIATDIILNRTIEVAVSGTEDAGLTLGA